MKAIIIVIILALTMLSCERASKSAQPVPQTNQKVVVIEYGWRNYSENRQYYKVKVLSNGTVAYAAVEYLYKQGDTIMVKANQIKY